MVIRMDYFIAGSSALKLIRLIRKGECDLKLEPSGVKTPTPLSSHHLTLRSLGLSKLCSLMDVSETSPLHLLVPTKAGRHRARSLKVTLRVAPRGDSPYCEVVSQDPARPSPYIPQGTRIFVESPSSVVLSMARKLTRRELEGKQNHQESVLRLLKLCLELCGTFTLDPHEPHTKTATFLINPVLTLDKCVSCALSVRKLLGLPLVRETLPMVFEKSASPAESFVGCALFCPTEYGGLSLGEYEANVERELSPHQRKMLSFDKLTPDFYMRKYGIAIEYNGEGHEKGDSPRRDRQRMNGYAMLGDKAFVLTRDEVRTLVAFNSSARKIVGAMENFDGPEVTRRFDALLADKAFSERQSMLFQVYRSHLSSE